MDGEFLLTESAEVLSGLWDHVGAEGHLNAAGRCAADGHVEENNWIWHFNCKKRQSASRPGPAREVVER